ncbi:MAG: hypothetical protein IPJ65_28005 [Archangiaceae bacterium]|nr:hypothetical protein [Archangiaceae bacterium]
MSVDAISRCADLERVDASSNRADEKVQRAVEKLRELRRARAQPEEVEAAQQAVLEARLDAQQARRSARALGSGDPGDRSKLKNAEPGSLVSVYA